jgi:hypothetical protein
MDVLKEASQLGVNLYEEHQRFVQVQIDILGLISLTMMLIDLYFHGLLQLSCIAWKYYLNRKLTIELLLWNVEVKVSRIIRWQS